MYVHKEINYSKLDKAVDSLKECGNNNFANHIEMIYSILKKDNLYNYIYCKNNNCELLAKQNSDQDEVKKIISLIYKKEVSSFAYFPIFREDNFEGKYLPNIPLTYVMKRLNKEKNQLLINKIIEQGSTLEKVICYKKLKLDKINQEKLLSSITSNEMNSGLALIFGIGDFYENYEKFNQMEMSLEKLEIEKLIRANYGLHLNQIEKLQKIGYTIKKLKHPSNEECIKQSIAEKNEMIKKFNLSCMNNNQEQNY